MPVTSHVLFNSYDQNGPGETRIDASYDPTGGVKGGLQYMSIIPDGALVGVYYARLKNIALTKMGSIDLNDGNFAFDVRRISYVKATIATFTPVVGSSASLVTNVRIDTVNNRCVIYVYDSTGTANIPSGCRINVSIIYNRFIQGGI